MKSKTKRVEGRGSKSNMNAKTVRYGRLKNLGNFENERCEVEVEVAPGETVAEAFSRAKTEVDAMLGLVSTPEGILDLAEKALKKARNAVRAGKGFDADAFED